jgi:hypothetical protein
MQGVSMPSEIAMPRRATETTVPAQDTVVVEWPPEAEALRLIRQADALGIPWRRILTREISTEGMLQRFLGSEVKELPLWRALSIIPNSLFHSWRVRDLVDRLAWEASAQGSREARREIASLVECLSGPQAQRRTEELARVKHYWFAYQHVLELQAAALAAERSRVEEDERTAEICESTGATCRDAEWAVARLADPARSHALDDAVTHAREEGFEIPHAATELQAFSRLRRFVLRHRIFRQKASGRRGRPRKTAIPQETPRDDASATP